MAVCFAGRGPAHPLLKNERFAVSFNFTDETLMEETHARIYKVSSKGRLCTPPQVSASIRLPQNLKGLTFWPCRLFVCLALQSRVPKQRKLLKFLSLTPAFVNSASLNEAIQAIYHCHPRQLFENLSADVPVHNAWDQATRFKALKATASEQLFIDYLRERLPDGSIFSLPTHVAATAFPGTAMLALPDAAVAEPAAIEGAPPPPDAVAELAVVAAAPAAAPIKASPHVLGALEVAVGACLAPASLRMADYCQRWHYKVVCSNVSRRFFLHAEPRKSVVMRVVRLRVCDQGEGPILVPADRTATNFDILAVLHAVTARVFLQGLIVWRARGQQQLHLALPEVPIALAHDCAAQHVLRPLMSFEGAGSEPGGFWCPISGRLISMTCDLNVETSAEVIDSLIASGALIATASDFGELVVHVNFQVLRLGEGQIALEGSANCLEHITLQTLPFASKLAVLMHLHAHGWRPRPARELTDYTIGDEKLYVLEEKRSKWYFCALALSGLILERLPLSHGLPGIRHHLSACYHRALCTLTDLAQLKKVLALADNAKPADKEFKALLDDADDDAEAEEEGYEAGHALALPAPAATMGADMDAQSMLLAAAQVVRALAPGSADFTKHPQCEVDGHTVSVHFDNFSHSSGKQRAYVKCLCKAHVRCFHYGVLDQWPDERTAVAWLAAWAVYPTTEPGKGIDRWDHRRFVPSDARLAELLPHVSGLDEV